jgi:hypothetical protein
VPPRMSHISLQQTDPRFAQNAPTIAELIMSEKINILVETLMTPGLRKC